MNQALSNLLGSASKIVFIMLALTACVGFVLKSLPTDQFMLLAGMAFAFYFSNKGETTPQANGSSLPYAGK